MGEAAAFLSPLFTGAVDEVGYGAMVLGALWALVMILVPVVRWVKGEQAMASAITAGTLLQTAAVFVVLAAGSWGPLRAVVVLVVVGAGGWLLEYAGTRSGRIFGSYGYTDKLKPQVAAVPAIIPAAWFMMLVPAWAIVILLGRGLGLGMLPIWLFAPLAGAAFTAWDLFLDPQMVIWDFWRWGKKGRYYGVPLSNFVGWWAGATVLSALAHPAVTAWPLPVMALFLVYTLTWVLHAIGHAVFWRLYLSAVVGTIAMGLFVAGGVFGLR